MYDFQFSVPGTYGQVCQLTDTIHNSDPIVGCHFFQAGVSFAAISWYSFPHPCTFNGTGFCGPFQWRGLSRESINELARDRWRGIDIREKRKNEFSKVRGQHSREIISPILLYMMFRRISMPTTKTATPRFPLSNYNLFLSQNFGRWVLTDLPCYLSSRMDFMKVAVGNISHNHIVTNLSIHIYPIPL
jgi:hypothetical protein